MASMTGPTVRGTDGTDFLHRERVASHYKVSAVTKWRLKTLIVCHILMLVLMMCRLSTSLCVLTGLRPPSFFQRLRLPRAHTWEFVWLCSILPAIVGLLALKKNRIFLMQQYLIGVIVFGLLPIVYAAWDLSDDLKDYWVTRKTNVTFMGFPMIVVWNMFFAIALQAHFFGIYFSYQLLKAWRNQGGRGKKVS